MLSEYKTEKIEWWGKPFYIGVNKCLSEEMIFKLRS